MTVITIDIDKPYNDKNIAAAILAIEQLAGKYVRHKNVWRSMHNHIHVDVYFVPDLGYNLPGDLDHNDLEDMYLLIYRLAAGDNIRRLRVDAAKFLRGEEIDHWLPSKEDYERMRDGK